MQQLRGAGFCHLGKLRRLNERMPLATGAWHWNSMKGAAIYNPYCLVRVIAGSSRSGRHLAGLSASNGPLGPVRRRFRLRRPIHRLELAWL